MLSPTHQPDDSALPPRRAGTPRLARTGYSALPGNPLRTQVTSAPDPSPIPTASHFAFLSERLQLTPRQAEVLHWIAEGKTNQEISIILACSFFTVKNHLKEIFRRLNVSSRTGAAATAYRVLSVPVEPPPLPSTPAPTRINRPQKRAS